ncbi:helix-turn-helix domain-containing protein [Hungatella hathewayi]|uniref:helix-turn-helix domain-containing protein n=1 Tax=Hungatella hathewayi TaxID=154046 RepID=UPI001C028209|nr:helix-turn-helix domain-containing protein [Hungatella hathewayi]MBT9798238.1 hypothetical protein [Hungatella hathewayi]
MLYERVKQLCDNEGITITELERILKFGNGTIHNWDKSDPTIRKALAVSSYFKISIDTLVSNSDIPSKASMDMAVRIDGYTEDQKNLIRCYMSLIENGKAG